jgi:aminoglycoside phosphotransferase (APT) family kinase protein
MALLNTLDAETTTQALMGWLAGRLSGAGDVEVSGVEIPPSSGLSMTTVMFKTTFTRGGEPQALDLVARVAPTGPGVFRDPDLRREFRLLDALGKHTTIAVPTVHWFEQESAVLGSPFIVMDRAYGRVPADDPPFSVTGWVLELSVDARRELCDNGLAVLAQVHAVDWKALGLEFLDEPSFGAPGTDQQLRRWADLYEWASDGEPIATIDAALEWARANMPPDEELVLNWGDPRLGNIVYGGDQSVQAVLDWEMATIASPEMDVGWWLFFQRFNSEGLGVPLPDGMPSREQTIAAYEQLTGRFIQHADFYEAFAALRISILGCRAGRLMIQAGALPPDNPMPWNNPGSQLLAKLLGLPAPSGQSQHFVGNR